MSEKVICSIALWDRFQISSVGGTPTLGEEVKLSWVLEEREEKESGGKSSVNKPTGQEPAK